MCLSFFFLMVDFETQIIMKIILNDKTAPIIQKGRNCLIKGKKQDKIKTIKGEKTIRINKEIRVPLFLDLYLDIVRVSKLMKSF